MADSNITKNALANSLKEIILEKPLAKISISDICNDCGMHRKSFYYHFKDKYELVNWIFYNDFVTFAMQEHYEDDWKFLHALIIFFYDNKEFYSKALEVDGQNAFVEYFEEIFQSILIEFLENAFSNNKNKNFFAKYFTDAFIMATKNWLHEKEVMEPDEFFSLIKESMYDVATVAVKKVEDDKDKNTKVPEI